MLNLLAAGIGAAASIFGANKDRKLAEDNANRNIALQKEFAQSGIQWKVEDAKAAGVHPLYALGANTHSFSPVQVGSNYADTYSKAGQDISRAISATESPNGRAASQMKIIGALQVERAGLENELLRSQIAKEKAAANPPIPTAGQRYLLDGQGPTALVEPKALERIAPDPEKRQHEAAAITDQGHTWTGYGWAPTMSKDAKDRLEEDTLGTLGWNIRNRVLPTFGIDMNTPNVPLKPGHVWAFDPVRQVYIQIGHTTHRKGGLE